MRKLFELGINFREEKRQLVIALHSTLQALLCRLIETWNCMIIIFIYWAFPLMSKGRLICAAITDGILLNYIRHLGNKQSLMNCYKSQLIRALSSSSLWLTLHQGDRRLHRHAKFTSAPITMSCTFEEVIQVSDLIIIIIKLLHSPQLASSEPSAQSGSSSHTHSLEMQCMVALHWNWSGEHVFSADTHSSINRDNKGL